MNKGLMIVFTGDGKGKTTAALGTALRIIGHGKKVGMVQFFKRKAGNGKRGAGEISAAKKIGAHFKAWSFGGGFTWNTARGKNAEGAQKAWKKCRELLKDPKYRLVVLDEILIALRCRFLRTAEVVKSLKRRPASQHVILTGRGAPSAIVRLADLVTEMKCVKHPFDHGVPAQPGIEF